MIVIVADDMGRHDLTSAGSKIQTPNLDSLSEMGVKERIKYHQFVTVRVSLTQLIPGPVT